MGIKEKRLSFEYINDLVFYDENFTYGEDCDYLYSDIISIKYLATANKTSVGTTYETYLCLHLVNGVKLRIKQEKSFLGIKEREKAEDVMRASSIFHEITFTFRMEKYEKKLHEKGFISWGDYQFCKNGDLFKNNLLIFNLKDNNVSKKLDIFTFEAVKKSKNLKESLVNFWKGNEIIDISSDRDCFLYFMKIYLGCTWKNEPVKSKNKPKHSEFCESILFLGAKICKADGKIDVEEIKTFSRYFGIDEQSFPGSAQIFTMSINSLSGINEPAQKIYRLFKGEKEPLEHIVIGLLQIASSDGIISNHEKKIIEKVCAAFNFPDEEIERIFLIFENIKSKNNSSASNKFYGDTRVQYLKILGLNATASYDAVKVKYKELVRKHHPDLLAAQGLPVERVKDSEEILKLINVAYNWLSNEENAIKR